MNDNVDQSEQRYWQPPGEAPYELPGDILEAELAGIHKRRERLQLNTPPPGGRTPPGSPAPVQESLVGLALSGGGIRSATFSLGVLQALAGRNLLKYVDYLSTVSGGGFIGSSLTWLMSKKAADDSDEIGEPFGVEEHNFPYGVTDPAEKSKGIGTPQRKLLDYLRQHGKYLTPGECITLKSGIAVVIRGAILNLLVWLPVLTLVWLAVLALLTQLYPVPSVLAERITAVALLVAGIVALVFVIVSIIYSVMTFFARRFSRWRYTGRRLFECVAGHGLSVFVIALIIAAVPHVKLLITTLSGFLSDDEKAQELIADILAFGGPAYILIGVILGYVAYGKIRETPLGKFAAQISSLLAIVLVLYGIGVTTFEAAVCTLPITGLAGETPWWKIPWCEPWMPTAVLILIGIALVTGWIVNVNYIALHRYYRDRLMETFMPDIDAALENKTGAARGANKARMSELWNPESPVGPYHLVNTNLVLVDSENRVWNARNGDNFVVAPLHCGGNATGWRKTDTFMTDRLTLATSMAISGAAANPNAGVGGEGLTTNPLVSLMMALLNFRLGNWVPNPRKDAHQRKRPNHFFPGLYEVLKLIWHSGYREDRTFLQLSDGGHFENTGIYELIRRRARVIILCDGGGDKDFTFSDIQDALSRIGADFLARIEFGNEPESLIPYDDAGYPKDAKMAEKGHLQATITYHDGTRGTLILLKTTLIPGLSMEVLGYKGANPDFPDETTADQFFSQDQVDAYRSLGYRIAEAMMNDQGIALEQRLIETYFPPTA